FESAPVGPGGKSVQADKEDGIVRRGGAQCLIRRVVRRPFAFVPAPADNPFAWRSGSGPLLHAFDDFLFGGNVFQVEADEAFAEIDQVPVGINEARKNRSSVKVHRASGRIQLLSLVGIADPNDAVAPNGD